MTAPRLFPVAALTAAVQEPEDVTRAMFMNDPEAAAMKSAGLWIPAAASAGLDGVQLSAALARPDAYIPPEAMLDPVAAHLAIRTLRDGSGTDLSEANAAEIISLCKKSGMRIFDLGFFENLLHPNAVVRNQIHQHLLRTGRAAVMLKEAGCTGVSGFIGGNHELDMDQNMAAFEEYVIPLLKKLAEMGLSYYIENCPMPGWTTYERFHNNIASTAGNIIKLRQIANKYGVGHMLKMTYDPSHDILQRTRPEWTFLALAAAGCADMPENMHSKDMFLNRAAVAMWGGHGRKIDLGCRVNGEPAADPKAQGGAWGRMVGGHGMPGIAPYDPEAMFLGERTDWLALHLTARIVGVNPSKGVVILEHEWSGPMRDPDQKQTLPRVTDMMRISGTFIRGIDMAAEGMYQGQLWAKQEELVLPGCESPIYQIPGLAGQAPVTASAVAV